MRPAHHILAFLCVHALASPVAEDMVIHERVHRVSPDFVDLGSPASNAVLNLRINLVSNDLAGLEATLKEISVPSNPTYGSWLSKEEVEGYVRPSPTTTSLVAGWLAQHGITNTRNISSAGDWIAFPITIAAANRMLGANFSTYAHSPSGKRYIRTLAYSIPATLRNSHIRLIHPTISFAGPVVYSSSISAVKLGDEINSTATYSCSDVVTPACLETLYNIPPTAATRNSGSTMAVTGYNNEFANAADLSTFLNLLRPDITHPSGFSVRTVDGGVNQQYPAGLEANLDLQYTVGIAPGIPATFISVGKNNMDSENGFLDVVNALLADGAPPQVLTTSYAFNSESGVPELLARVTLVGGTQNMPEQGATFSAGGFSEYFPQQDWQSTAVNAYLAQLGSQYAGRFNRGGRGYPDVSAQGYRLEIIQQGQQKLVAGTSCSSPIFAAIIALLNDERLNAGRPVLGFLNPWLYANPGAFNDIVGGNNPGCGTLGFSAIDGWDPVTGLGTPDYSRMRVATLA
ncbi:subtilisin-like protein [Mycena vulgaris]|nr:subtilisin-like protein [Mycena vulgaris]